MNLIASIYIKDNKTVNIKSGDFRTLKVYPESPIDLLNQFESVGIKEVYVCLLYTSQSPRDRG